MQSQQIFASEPHHSIVYGKSTKFCDISFNSMNVWIPYEFGCLFLQFILTVPSKRPHIGELLKQTAERITTFMAQLECRTLK
jgi:hypothetical protein